MSFPQFMQFDTNQCVVNLRTINKACFCLKLNNGFDFFLPTEGDGERMAWLCSFCILVNFFLLCELARGEEAEIYCLNYKFAREHLGL